MTIPVWFTLTNESDPFQKHFEYFLTFSTQIKTFS